MESITLLSTRSHFGTMTAASEKRFFDVLLAEVRQCQSDAVQSDQVIQASNRIKRQRLESMMTSAMTTLATETEMDTSGREIQMVASQMTSALVNNTERVKNQARVAKCRSTAKQQDTRAQLASKQVVSCTQPATVQPEVSTPRSEADAKDIKTPIVVAAPEKPNAQRAVWNFEKGAAEIVVDETTYSTRRVRKLDESRKGGSPVVATFEVQGSNIDVQVASIYWAVVARQSNAQGVFRPFKKQKAVLELFMTF